MNRFLAQSGPSGFAFTPEVGLLLLGLLATILVVAIFAWLLIGGVREERRQERLRSEGESKESE